MKMLTRRGVLIEEMGQTCAAEPDADSEEARTVRPLQAATITYRIVYGARVGQKVLTLRAAMPREGAARQPCVPASTGSTCTPRCASRPTTASGWSSCADTSRDPRSCASRCGVYRQARGGRTVVNLLRVAAFANSHGRGPVGMTVKPVTQVSARATDQGVTVLGDD